MITIEQIELAISKLCQVYGEVRPFIVDINKDLAQRILVDDICEGIFDVKNHLERLKNTLNK